jgi:hypothetical protein
MKYLILLLFAVGCQSKPDQITVRSNKFDSMYDAPEKHRSMETLLQSQGFYPDSNGVYTIDLPMSISYVSRLGWVVRGYDTSISNVIKIIDDSCWKEIPLSDLYSAGPTK